MPTSPRPAATLKPLKGVRILSLALNLPGPAALMRCRAMGATCAKLEPPAPAGAAPGSSSDPMALYGPKTYQALQAGIKTHIANLKTDAGQKVLHRELARADVLLTSFRPAALNKLGLDWKTLHQRYPLLGMVAIVGAPGARADEPGHDLTYMADNDLITGLDLPPTAYADMGGSLLASEAILQVRLQQLQKQKGVRLEVALSDAAAYLALPRAWGLMAQQSMVGGGHAGYAVYACKDGRVALAALEPHFVAPLAEAMGLADKSVKNMFTPEARAAIVAFMAGKTRRQLDALARVKDIPLCTLK
jgi:crotonobetainyl-CoA:carnitine CoA-transferase CaiB-like acyl-CoA transferase